MIAAGAVGVEAGPGAVDWMPMKGSVTTARTTTPAR